MSEFIFEGVPTGERVIGCFADSGKVFVAEATGIRLTARPFAGFNGPIPTDGKRVLVIGAVSEQGRFISIQEIREVEE